MYPLWFWIARRWSGWESKRILVYLLVIIPLSIKDKWNQPTVEVILVLVNSENVPNEVKVLLSKSFCTNVYCGSFWSTYILNLLMIGFMEHIIISEPYFSLTGEVFLKLLLIIMWIILMYIWERIFLVSGIESIG